MWRSQSLQGRDNTHDVAVLSQQVQLLPCRVLLHQGQAWH
jgi:hypothetical protein